MMTKFLSHKNLYIKCMVVLYALLWTPWDYATPVYGQELLQIRHVELKRMGKQLNVRIICDSSPVYEINANLDYQTLIVKFKNAKTNFTNGRTERLFNDPLMQGVRFIEVGDEIWAQFKTRMEGLTYTIAENSPSDVLEIEFRPKKELPIIPPPPRPPKLRLTGTRFGIHPPDFSRAVFIFTGEPRILIVQDKKKKTATIRFSDTQVASKLKIDPYEDNRIRYVELTQEPNQIFVTITSTTGALEIKDTFLMDPPRWVLDFYGEPGLKEESKEAAIAENKEETKQERRARISRQNRRMTLKNMYQEGEQAFRKGLYENAIKIFRDTYAKAKNNVGAHGDILEPIAIQSLFRIADAIYTMLEKKEGSNYHSAIAAYKTAIRIALDNEAQLELVPHAYFRVGRSYQKMKFHTEADLMYKILQDRYPETLEAAEANFWKAFTQVERRKWKRAITDFLEYLHSSPNPKHLAATHYKMAEAYYELKKYPKAHESFERARAIDLEYPNNDPSLLFHMGETYYENADYATAREIFKILLKRYPTADFSRLVALRQGDFLRDEGQEDEAIAIYKNAIGSYSREVALLGKMRIANIQAQRPYSLEHREALQVYDEIITLYPDSSLVEEAMLRKGLTLTLFGFYEQAIKALENYMEQYPQSIYVQRGIIQENIDENLKGMIDHFFQDEDYLGVVGVYQDYRTRYLSDFRFDTTLFQVGLSYQRLGLFDEALDIYKFLESRATGPLKELIHLQSALTLSEKGDLPQARDSLARFLKDYPDSLYDADARQQLAKVYRRNRQFPEAIVVYEQTIRKYDKDTEPLLAEIVPELYFELAELYNEQGRYAEAEEAYREVIKHYYHPVVGTDVPDYVVKSHFLVADMLYKLRNDSAALQQYEKAMALYKDRNDEDTVERKHWARYQTGVLYQRIGQEEKALAIFKQLVDSEAGKGKLWKKLAVESYQALSRQLAYEDYLNQ